MTTRKNQIGFSIIEIIIGLVVVSLIGFVGYTFYTRQQAANNKTTSTNSVATQVSVPTAPTISSTSDLDKAGTTLDQVNVDGSNSSDSSQFDSQLSSF